MLLSDLLQTASRGITANKKRTFLTMLGIIIGVASVVLMVSMGRSFQHYILTQIDSIGTNTMDIFPQGLEKFGGNLDTLTEEDFEAIRRLPSVESVAPAIIVAKPVHYGREERSPIVFGTTDVFFANYSLKLASGRLLDETDEQGAKSVAVVSSKTAEELFGNRSPLGERITIGDKTFTVVGTLQKQGSLLLSDLDTPVYIPFSSARALTGQRFLNYINLRTVVDPDLAKQEVTDLLRDRHNIRNPENDTDKDDFIARTADQITSIVGSVTLGLTIFLGLVAAISLLVGGIGIMNIMLVSVTERTREIGLRKAVGAKRRDILLQFLLESATLTLLGGIIGIIIGAGMGWLLSALANRALGQFSFVLSIPSILLAVLMAVGTGLIFGLYPAKKAASLSPMEALRFE